MSIATLFHRVPGRVLLAASLTVMLALSAVTTVQAGPREQARRIHDRIAGVPPTNAVLQAMADDITAGNPEDAVDTAMQNPNFLNVTVKNMVMPWTNKEQTVFAPLNDAAATLIGLIRDGTDFRTALYGNIIYTGNDGSLPAYSNNNNNHYIEMEHRNLDLRTVLQSTTQSSITGLPSNAVAGVLTTRQSARAFFYAGTNRAMFRFTMMNYLCRDLEQVKDTTRISERIRQDVSRSPGGDSSVFLNNCLGCHAGMDGMAGASAYYNWGPAVFDPDADPDVQSLTYVSTAQTFDIDGDEYTSRVTPKHRINPNNFPYGYVISDDSWINYWRTGVNANLGWASNAPQQPTTGSGMSSLGQELANTTAFARCQVIKVYRQVCLNDPNESTLSTITGQFVAGNYDMRIPFRRAALDCSAHLN